MFNGPQLLNQGCRIPGVANTDARLIVLAAGERSSTGPVMGAGDLPIAISNPIYVDVDGGGFKPNRGTLGTPLPVKAK